MNLGDIPRRNSDRFPEKTAIVFENHSHTWRDVNNRVNALAHALREQGLKKGDRLGILMQNCLQYWEVYWAAAKMGIINVPLSYRLTPGELEQLVNHASIKGLVTGEECYSQVDYLKEKVETLTTIIGIDNVPDYMLDYEELVSTYPVDEPSSVAEEDDIFAIFYTSGTTGLPKGAMVSHRNLEANSLNQMIVDRSEHDDVNLVSTPLYHMGAVFFGITYHLLGCTTHVHRRFNPRGVLEGISRDKITVMLLIPTMLNMMLNDPHFDDYDLSSLRLVFYGGGPMPQKVLERAIEKLDCGFTQGYGLTETLEATFLTSEDHRLAETEQQRRRLTSAGREAVTAEVRIVDDEGNELPPGEVGEILIKSYSVVKGYWNMPELSAEVIKDGWFYTEDLGYLDDERYLFVVDRKKDMIISGGVNIYPKEIEEVLFKHPKVLEAAIIGVPDEMWGESIMAVVVLKEGENATAEEIIDYCQQHLASLKKPKIVEFVDAIPKNPSGKVLKRVLRDRYVASK